MKIKLENVRLSYPHLWKATAFEDNDRKTYNAAFLLPKNGAQVKKLEKVIKAVAEEKWGAKATTVLTQLKAKNYICLHDGDVEKPDTNGYKGMMYVNANNADRPLILAVDTTILNEGDAGAPYGGCYVYCTLDIWAQDNSFGKRINASLTGVQMFRDGEAFGGATPASVDDFEDLSEGVDDDFDLA